MVSSKTTDIQSLVAKLEAYMNACSTIDQFSGAVFLSLNGQRLLNCCHGMADLEHCVPNTSRTKFRLGSITKPITAMAVLMLEEQGALSMLDPVSKYLNDTPKAWEEIRIKDLMTHRSGLVNFTDLPDYPGTQRLPTTPGQTIDRFKNMPLVSAPGETSRYNNSGYIVLGAIIEHVSGKNYADFLAENLFAPLRMHDTGYDSAEMVLQNRARGYVRSKQSVINANLLDMTIPYAAGGLFSTIDDLFVFDQAIAKTVKPIPDAIFRTMSGDIHDNYSSGWHIDHSNGRLKVAHSGGIDGFCTIMMRLPQENLTVVVLSNVVSWQHSPEGISQDLASIVFDEPYEIPRIRRAIKLDTPEFDKYLGNYQLEDMEMQLSVTKDHGRWMLQFTDQEAFEVFPETEIDFFVLDFEGQLKFCLNTIKEVTHMILLHGGQPTRAYKLK